MELSPRKRVVLAAVIKNYIETGEPVGSKILTSLIENAPSSATLRNEMSDLCNLGLLEQPHTSAGRIPTSNGLRFYIDSLMSPSQLSQSARSFIDKGLENIHCDVEKIPAVAGQILSDLTGLPAITCFMTDESPKIRRVELLPVSRSSVMVLLITTDGRTRNQIFRLGAGFTPDLVDKFENIVKNKINCRLVSELSKAYMQSVVASFGIDSLKLMPLVTSIFEMADGFERSDIDLSGRAYLYDVCSNEDTARRILALTKRRDPIISLLERIEDGVGVIFGSDTGYRELQSNTIVAVKYSCSDKYKGAIGVIGPNRMSYDLIIPSIEYISQRLTSVMLQAQKDMED